MAQPTTSSPVSPWGKKEVCSVKPFMDVMDEEYAKQLEENDIKENEEEFTKQCKEIEEVSLLAAHMNTSEEGDETECKPASASDDYTDNDLLLAKLLQLEYDKENDQHIRSLEKNYNGSNKVSMSFKNFYSQHPYDTAVENEFQQSYEDSSDESDEELDARKPTGKVKHGSEIITKHDSLISERKNTKKIEQFSSDFKAGDVDKNVRLPNHVFNKLKLHSMKEEKTDMRLHEKQEHSTHEKALDEHTRLLLYKMVNNGTLDSLNGVIATGKESVLIYAKADPTEGTSPPECALKVYKTTLSEFKTREKYIREDHRFRDRFQKQNPRKIIKLWAEKEFRNLQRMEEAGIRCPKAVLLRKHVLVMSFIGSNSIPAPKLKDALLNKTQLAQAYIECISTMKTLFEKCNLIHADLSEYNVLWHDSNCVFIDVSQSVEPTHAQAFHFLFRDCKNITRFFAKAGVQDVMKDEELFTYVCGRELGETCLDDLENECKENFEGNEELLAHGIDSKNFAFDYHFRQSELSKCDDKQEEESKETSANESEEVNTESS